MLILISGGSCAGKSRFSSELKDFLEKKSLSCTVLTTDMFYKEIPPETELYDHNFDSIGSVDSGRMTGCCKRILSGEKFIFRTFEFRTHSLSGIVEQERSDVLILEGIFAFCFPPLLSLSSLNLFVDAGEQIRYERRYDFYSRILGQSDEFIIHKIQNQARPFFDSEVYPSRSAADLILNGERPFDRAVACIGGWIISQLSEKGGPA